MCEKGEDGGDPWINPFFAALRTVVVFVNLLAVEGEST